MKKKSPKLNCIVPLVIYPFDIMFSFNQSDDELVKVLDKYKVKHEDDSLWKFETETTSGRCCIFPYNQILVRLRNFPDTSFEYGVLSHEIFHAVAYVLYKTGFKLSIGKSDEAYAYLIGYLTQQIFIKIREERIKK